MSNYATLKSAIQSAVYTNGNGEITGAALQAVLLQIVNTVGGGYTFKGVATPGTSPGTPDENVFYIGMSGTYTNFGTTKVVKDGEIGVFMYNGSWSSQVLHFFSFDDFVESGGVLSDTLKGILSAATSVPFVIQDHLINVTGDGDYIYEENTAWDMICFTVKRESDWAVVSGMGTGSNQACLFLDPEIGFNTGAKLVNSTTLTKYNMSVFEARIKAIRSGGYDKDILVCVDIKKANAVDYGNLCVMQGKFDSRYFCVPNLTLYGNTGSPLLNYNSSYNITPFLKIDGKPIASINFWSGTNTSNLIAAGLHFYNSSYGYLGTLDMTNYSDTGETNTRAIVIEVEDIPAGAEYIRFSASQTNIDANKVALAGGVQPFESLGVTHYTSEHFFDKSSEERIGALPFAMSFATLRLSDLYLLNGEQLIIAGTYVGENPSPTWSTVVAKVAFFDANRDFVSALDYTSTKFPSWLAQMITVAISPSEIPAGAKYVAFFSNTSNLYKPCIISGIANLNDPAFNYPLSFGNYEQIRKMYVSNQLSPNETLNGYFMRADGLRTLSSYSVRKYAVNEGEEYLYSLLMTSSSQVFVPLFFMDALDNIVGMLAIATGPLTINDALVTIPKGATQAWQNVPNALASSYTFSKVTDTMKVDSLQAQVSALGGSTERLMKVVVNADDTFYIRTRYNATKDIIVTHYINGNGLISFSSTYVGSNALTDAQLMDASYLVSSHSDSTAPLRRYTQYWHLFAQHGYPIPYFENTVGMTSADVGAKWKDQLDREYTIGKVTAENVYLLPVIYQDADGHYTRDWQSTATSTTITALTYVSGGGAGAYTSPISVSDITQQQLLPIMEHAGRTWTADGRLIAGAGTYYCDDFGVSETQYGYDPATISDWFGGEGGAPDLTGASVMAQFTFSYNYKGAQCALNTTINLLREAKGTFSATQQQFFFDNGDYKAMFMIPKAAAQNGVELDKPFNSASAASTAYTIARTATQLKDIDDPVDRQIGYLYDSGADDYLVGMAAGLSLVSGDTVKAKRNINRPLNSTLLMFSPANNNKFYINALDSDVYGSGYFPAGYFKEINAYVSYFDPAENVGQVYWYKEGSGYVIYAHCQSEEHNLAVSVPPFMEGLSLSVVEKTADASLLTDSIHNGKLFVDYAAAGANYIVLTAK